MKKLKKPSTLQNKPYPNNWYEIMFNLEISSSDRSVAENLKILAIKEVEKVGKQTNFTQMCACTERYAEHIIQRDKITNMQEIIRRAYYEFVTDMLYTFLTDIIFNRLSDFARKYYPDVYITNREVMKFSQSQLATYTYKDIQIKFKNFLLTK